MSNRMDLTESDINGLSKVFQPILSIPLAARADISLLAIK